MHTLHYKANPHPPNEHMYNALSINYLVDIDDLCKACVATMPYMDKYVNVVYPRDHIYMYMYTYTSSMYNESTAYICSCLYT